MVDSLNLAFLSCDSIFDHVFRILISIGYGANTGFHFGVFRGCLPWKDVSCFHQCVKPLARASCQAIWR